MPQISQTANQMSAPISVAYAPGPAATYDQLAAYLTDGYWNAQSPTESGLGAKNAWSPSDVRTASRSGSRRSPGGGRHPG